MSHITTSWLVKLCIEDLVSYLIKVLTVKGDAFAT